jgi:Peptidase family M23
MKHLLNILLFLTIGLSVRSQQLDPIDPNYYAPPLKIPFFLAGNFAELRPNHFHAGIDIKTQGKTGLPVYAAAAGYISKITISPSGYGNAMYINHPNGTTTVYGHLESFAPQVEEYIRKIQYEKEVFAIEQEMPEGTFPIKKGEQIARSGNAGSSGGPHLHFEIRRTKEQIVLNPLLFHMPLKDDIKPTIQAVMVYPVSDDATVSGKQVPQRFETVLAGNTYQIKANPTIQVYGKIGFGIQSIDKLDGNPNQCGIYSMKLTVDNELIFSFTLDDFAQNESRYINSLLDYDRAIRTGQRLYRTWLQPGNKLNIYDTVEKRGIYKATDEKLHQVKYEITDAYGNETSLAFQIQSKEIKTTPKESKGEEFKYNRNNRIRNDELEFSIPEGALYDDVNFLYSKKPALPKFYSPVFQLHNAFVPLHFACPLRIKAGNLPANLQDKAMLAQIDPTSGKIYSATGKYVDGWVEGNIKILGNYVVAVDNVAPKITSLSIGTKKPQKITNDLKFKVTDNLSGIETFRGTIDGKWVLFEYDMKNNLLSYTFDKTRFQFNKNHSLILVVTDFKGNASTYKANFHK